MRIFEISLLAFASAALGIPDVAQIPLRAGGGEIHSQFMSAEHAFIGDHTRLRFPNRELWGGEQNFKVGGQSVSYGMVVALAGDYFGNWAKDGRCPPSISDTWSGSTNVDAAVDHFTRLAADMTADKENAAACILPKLTALSNDVCYGVKGGGDPIQIYKQTSSNYDDSLTLCPPIFRYAILALCNWDHFGQDAIDAYTAGHTAALRRAVKASKDNDPTGLEYAYFLEAYAQHFLTDLFSAGHIRTPRRPLHADLTLDELLKMAPADRNCQKQHDEDCANGLWVVNKLGEGWAVYGDKELMSSKNYRNMDQAIDAVQLGVDEVWEAYNSGVVKPVESYKALEKVPDLSRIQSLDNFTPIYSYDVKMRNTLKVRSNLSDRSITGFNTVALNTIDVETWEKLLQNIKASGPDSSPHPASVDGLLPETGLLQVRRVSETLIGVNRYGLLTTRNYNNSKIDFCKIIKPKKGDTRRSWTMVGQEQIQIPKFATLVAWKSVISLGNGGFAVVGSRTDRGSAVFTVFLGIKSVEIQRLRFRDGSAVVSTGKEGGRA